MRRGVRGLKGIKVINKPNGRRYVYRRVGSRLVSLPDLPEDHPRFIEAYVEAGKAAPPPRQPHPKGSIAALCTAYLGSADYHRLAPSTRAVWRRTIDRIQNERGAGMVRDLRPEHLRKDVRALSPGAAQMRLKAWRSLMRHALDEGWIAADPSQGVKAPQGTVTPHRQWTLEEIAAYRAHWHIGTPQRLAFEVIYWTGARCIDARTLGWQMVDNAGWLTFTQQKTSGRVTLPITAALPSWAASMAVDRSHLLDALGRTEMQWIVTTHGAARSVKGLSQWMSANARAAGLPKDCTAHGLRKARAAALAESGATASQIGAWTGHASLSEVSHYTRQADLRRIIGGGETSTDSGNRIAEFPKLPKK